jgi:hypothetical protein
MLIPTAQDVYDHLVAGRYDEARFVALQSSLAPWLPSAARTAIREGRWQDAICRIERDILPRRAQYLSRIGGKPEARRGAAA